jgi:hypothetical protein
MRVSDLNIPKAVSAERALEISKEARHRLAVLEHYARYRYAYGLAEGPTLPLR